MIDNNLLEIALSVHAALFGFGFVLLMYALHLELKEGRFKKRELIKDLGVCVFLLLIPIVNLFIIRSTIKEI